MKKTISLFSIFLVSLLVFATGCGCNKKSNEKKDEKKEEINNIKYNTNQGIIEDKEVGGLHLTNTSLETSEYSSTLVTLVSNPTDKNIQVGMFRIYVKDKDDNLIKTIIAYVGGEIEAGESKEITTNIDMSLENAFKVEYEIINN